MSHAQANHRMVGESQVGDSRNHRTRDHCGRMGDAENAGGRDSRSVRRAGDRDDGVARPGAADRGRSGHLSAGDRDAQGAADEIRTRHEPVRTFRSLRGIRGRDGHLLGPLARPRVPEQRARQASRGSEHDAGTRRNRRGVGDAIHPCRYERPAESRATKGNTGLDSAARAHRSAGSCRDRVVRRIRETVSGRSGSGEAAGIQHSAEQGGGRRPRVERRRWRAGARDGRNGAGGARSRTIQKSRRHSLSSDRLGSRWHADHRRRCCQRSNRPGDQARDLRPQRQGERLSPDGW